MKLNFLKFITFKHIFFAAIFSIVLLDFCYAFHCRFNFPLFEKYFKKNHFFLTSQISNYVDVKKPLIALTFDDGPKPGFAEDILDILKFYKVKATFFLVGKQVRENPEIVKRIFSEGHEIGNHTYNHLKLTSLSDDKVIYEIRKAGEEIEKIVGQKPEFFRAPGGRINKRILKLIEKEGLKVVGWSLNAGDYLGLNGENSNLKTDKIIKKIVNQARAGDIILMHNGGSATRESLPIIIKELKEKNFQFVTVKSLFDLETQGEKDAR